MTPVLVRSKASWNPLRSPAVAVIWADRRASVTSAGTGRASFGPMRSVMWTGPCPTGCSDTPVPSGRRDVDDPSDPGLVRQLPWIEYGIGVGDPPPLAGVAEVLLGEQIGPLACPHDMFLRLLCVERRQ